MSISKKSAEKSANNDIKVTRAKDLDKVIMFDMEVNGVTIYGCSYKTLQKKDGSGDFAKVDFPSRKGSDDKWYHIAYVKLSDADIETIEKGIEALI